ADRKLPLTRFPRFGIFSVLTALWDHPHVPSREARMTNPLDCAIALNQDLQSNDRRDSKRLGCELVGKARPCTALEASNQWPVKVCDISANGVAVIVCRRFEQGTVLSLTLSGPDADDVAMPL